MLTVHHSNQLDVLKDLLVSLIQRDPIQDPFTDEQILVQSPGMAQWLRLELAKSLGIAAGTAFPLPASFIWEMFKRTLPGVPARSAFTKDSMTWKLVTLLPTLLDQEAFAPLRHYLEDDPDGIRCYQLAGKIADTYDQYLVYRPDWVLDWEAGDDRTDITADQPWQPILWRALVKHTADLGQSHWHRANLYEQFTQQLQKKTATGVLPKRLFVFGISALPPNYVEALKALGEHIEVHLMITNPCRYYWGDIKDPKYLARLDARLLPSSQKTSAAGEAGNPLLASMGKLGRDYLHQLYELPAGEIDAFVDIDRDNLLANIQADILNLEDNTEVSSPFTIKDNDHSLSLHSCHSPMREVEVLHDHLLGLLEQNPALTPKDIVVMMPDVDSYSPCVQAVFGSAPEQRFIPFSVSDLSTTTEHPVLEGLLHLLSLNTSRASAPELLELLEIPAILDRFGLTSGDFELLREWVPSAGIRWGLNEDHQTSCDLPARNSNTWAFGLRRMLLGYAMPEAAGLYQDIYPFEASQGMAAERIGRLASFIEQIEYLSETLEQPRSAPDWILYINQLLESFFTPEAHEYPLDRVRRHLEELKQQLEDAGYTDTLPLPVLFDYLNERLSNERGSQRFLAGQVNFCTLMPMRSIPFKIVCLLGMNDGAYPRSLPPTGFDLIARHTQRGDRSRRDDDRYLFLEALLSARQQLYISYVGRSIRDDSERTPSVLVTELLDYCCRSCTLESDIDASDKQISAKLLQQHTLQPFSPECFKPDHQSYAAEWLPAAISQNAESTEYTTEFLNQELPAAEVVKELELSELLRFYRNPCKYFFNRRLKVWFEAEDETLEEQEPFNLDGLQRYQILGGLLESQLKHGNTDGYEAALQASGQLPHGHFGDILLDDQKETITEMSKELLPAIQNPVDDIEVDLELQTKQGSVRLTGWLRGCYESGLVRYRTAQIKGTDILRAGIEHLACCASGHDHKTLLAGTEDQMIFHPVPPDDAIKHLQLLAEYYQSGLDQPLPFFPLTIWAWLKSGEDEETAHKAFYDTWNKRGESLDPYIARVYPVLESDVYSRMKNLAEKLMKPVTQLTSDNKSGEAA
ncbi:exodeoxyribonuclease V subunit gamma [Spongorhabdus nitratireducens]